MTYPCKCCSGTEFIYLFPGKDRLHGLPGEFKVEECKHCGVIATHPQLSSKEVEKYYPENYLSYPSAIEDERSWFKKIDRQFGVEKRCRAVIKRSGKASGKVLDIGCATGVFLNGMKQHGWKCYGIEPSNFASEYATNRFGLNVFYGYLEDGFFEDNFFDVITLWDVFEHLSEPVETLHIISKILKPGGLLVITTPNANSWDRKIFGQYWVGWEVPRHYHVFTPKTITGLLKLSNFYILNIISFTGALSGISNSIGFWVNEISIPNWSKKLINTISKSIIFRVLLFPFLLLTNKINRSTIMTIFAKNNYPITFISQVQISSK